MATRSRIGITIAALAVAGGAAVAATTGAHATSLACGSSRISLDNPHPVHPRGPVAILAPG